MRIKRFLNFVIDAFSILVITFLIIVIISLLDLNIVRFKYLCPLVALLYYIFMEGLFGKTIGKYITKTKVQYLDQKFHKLFYALVRTLFRLIPVEPISVILNKKCLMWHDFLSKSRVVKV